MRVYGWSIYGLELSWDQVEAWRIEDGRLSLRYDRDTHVGPTVASVRLPASIIGLTDDDWANHNRPTPTMDRTIKPPARPVEMGRK